MRTTVRLDEALARKAKAAAAARGLTFTQAIDRALREWIRDGAPAVGKRVPFNPPLSDAWSAPMTVEQFKQMVDEIQEEDDLRKMGVTRAEGEDAA